MTQTFNLRNLYQTDMVADAAVEFYVDTDEVISDPELQRMLYFENCSPDLIERQKKHLVLLQALKNKYHHLTGLTYPPAFDQGRYGDSPYSMVLTPSIQTGADYARCRGLYFVIGSTYLADRDEVAYYLSVYIDGNEIYNDWKLRYVETDIVRETIMGLLNDDEKTFISAILKNCI